VGQSQDRRSPSNKRENEHLKGNHSLESYNEERGSNKSVEKKSCQSENDEYKSTTRGKEKEKTSIRILNGRPMFAMGLTTILAQSGGRCTWTAQGKRGSGGGGEHKKNGNRGRKGGWRRPFYVERARKGSVGIRHSHIRTSLMESQEHPFCEKGKEEGARVERVTKWGGERLPDTYKRDKRCTFQSF